jgi:hypothetical protein
MGADEYRRRRFEDILAITKDPVAAAIIMSSDQISGSLNGIKETIDFLGTCFSSVKMGEALDGLAGIPDHLSDIGLVGSAIESLTEAVKEAGDGK